MILVGTESAMKKKESARRKTVIQKDRQRQREKRESEERGKEREKK